MLGRLIWAIGQDVLLRDRPDTLKIEERASWSISRPSLPLLLLQKKKEYAWVAVP